MSRILRRPMFRGGKVIDSRGTGITSGLMDGGRVGYQSAGFVTGQQIMDANKNNPFFKTNKINPLSKFVPTGGTSELDNLIRATMFDTEKFPLVGKEAKLSDTASLTDFYKSKGDENENILLASTDTSVIPKITKKTEGSEGEIDTSSTETEKFKSPTMEIKEKDFSGEIETTPTIITDDPDEQPVVEDPDQDIKEMADRYFELMGGGKAFSRDVGDMLLRFAGAEGDTTADKFKAYLRDEAKAGPSRTEKIKDAAAKTAINYATQKEFLEKKLASSESIAEKNIIAQQIRDLNKKYAPGITEKNVKFLTGLKKGTAEHTAALKQSGFGFNIFQEAKKAAADFEVGKLTSQDINSLGPIYYDDWKGIFKQGVSDKDGTYLIIETQEIVKIKDGKDAGRQKIEMQ